MVHNNKSMLLFADRLSSQMSNLYPVGYLCSIYSILQGYVVRVRYSVCQSMSWASYITRRTKHSRVSALLLRSGSLLLRYIPNMSCIMRKCAFCICENKGADQLHGNHAADQRLCFHFTDSIIPLLSI